jgi:hypothetical protein
MHLVARKRSMKIDDFYFKEILSSPDASDVVGFLILTIHPERSPGCFHSQHE